MSFSWVPFYRELAGKVLEFEDRQDELIGILREMKSDGLSIISLKDFDTHNQEIELRVIDPFTFCASWNRGDDKPGWEKKRRELCQFLKEKWDFKSPIPEDFKGTPTITPVASWFLAYERDRPKSDVEALWKVAREITTGGLSGVTNRAFSRALQVRTVALPKLTMGLFWVAPNEALALDQLMVNYLEHHGISWNKKASRTSMHELDVYRKIVQDVHIRLGIDHPKISYDAFTWSGYGRDDREHVERAPDTTTSRIPLNQILYGPPGTGKTYNSIRRAVEIIDGKVGDGWKERVESLRENRQIEFVTFHQSFSYEEFIEGLRPVIGDESGQVSYEIRDGILKQIALRASNSSQSASTPKRPTFELIWQNFIQNLENSEDVIRAVGKGSGRYKVQIEEEKFVRGTNLTGHSQRGYSVPIRTIEKIWHGLQPAEKPTSQVIRMIYGDGKPKGLDCNLGGAILQALQEIETKLLIGNQSSNLKGAKSYVLIIDEINRGNISKILGELITLLEDDKRIGAENELRLTLPTSGETFALPPNLYILGTMNTSDKSLAQLDVALRRRFAFEEMAPLLELCELFPDQIPVLKELNNRLEWALDREHRLGHAYFMKVANKGEFDEVFQSKVLPLLLEYFPHDFQTLRAVLGEKSDGFLREMSKPEGFAGSGKKYRWWFEVEGAEGFSAFETLKSNYGL